VDLWAWLITHSDRKQYKMWWKNYWNWSWRQPFSLCS